MNRFAAYAMIGLAALTGWGSLLLFGVFLVAGPVAAIRLGLPERQALLWDGALSLLFFIQHSGMIRASFRRRLSAVVADHYHPAIYTIASAVVLSAAVLLWQSSETIIWQAEGLLRLSIRAVAMLAFVGFIWGVRALGNFDAFGLNPIRVNLRGRQLRPTSFVTRGPYLWVRHPLYFFVLVLIWSFPDVSLDRLLFNVFWTLWIVFGTHLEEKDLVAEFGEQYRQYQKAVPMLFPWRLPRGSKPRKR